mmetsp:Transcript_33409/g.48696  ORF Transcript_33409/g.48696 Transcript_33409/m.48696 type:complete len:141 (+) Transcript_33409:103-525(+)
MPQYRVVVPSNVIKTKKAKNDGEPVMIRIRTPDGTEADVPLPEGLQGGESFVFELPGGSSDSSANNSEQSSLRQRKQGRGNGGGRKGGGNTAATSSNAEVGSFLDREIVDWQDFCTALMVGIFIGLCIVAGFVAGVLISY